MSHRVPDFDMDEDYSLPTSSNRSKKTATGDEDIMELLWQDGQVVTQNQTQRSFKKSFAGGSGGGGGAVGETARSTENDAVAHHQQQLFMHEDEMSSWLHYPIDDSSFDRDIYSDLLYPTISASISSTTTATIPENSPREIRTTITEIRQQLPPVVAAATPVTPALRPPIPPPLSKCASVETAPEFQNFMHISGFPKTRIESGPLISSKLASTAMESNETPAVGQESKVSRAAADSMEPGCGTMSLTTPAGTSMARDFATTCELSVTSSPGGSGASVSGDSVEPSTHKLTRSPGEDRKRKGRESDDAECHSEDVEFESSEGKKQGRGSSSTKRSRAAEVHNLSERRRRDRINEKMKALQELIPRCNKSDKASMLDEAIEYLKSLQLQVQMMSMGCGMIPMMYPGVQQYMPSMGMGIDMSMNRPIMPYPALMPGPGMPIPPAPANIGPRFPVPAFHMQPIPIPDPSRIQVAGQSDPMLSSLIANNPNQPRPPIFPDPYQQFIGLHQSQMSIPQSQVVSQSLSNKPSTNSDDGNPENQQTG